jgi:hypothetical protein
MKRLIAAFLIFCATIVVVTVAVIRHVNHKQHVAWCYITATPTTPPKTASASEHAENSSKSVSSSYIAASNTQHDQRYKSDGDEQCYERDGVVFKPMPITGKH